MSAQKMYSYTFLLSACDIKHDNDPLGRPALPRHGSGEWRPWQHFDRRLWFLDPSNEGLPSVSSRKRASPLSACLSVCRPAGFNPTPQNNTQPQRPQHGLCFNRQKQLIRSQQWLTLSITQLTLV